MSEDRVEDGDTARKRTIKLVIGINVVAALAFTIFLIFNPDIFEIFVELFKFFFSIIGSIFDALFSADQDR